MKTLLIVTAVSLLQAAVAAPPQLPAAPTDQSAPYLFADITTTNKPVITPADCTSRLRMAVLDTLWFTKPSAYLTLNLFNDLRIQCIVDSVESRQGAQVFQLHATNDTALPAW